MRDIDNTPVRMLFVRHGQSEGNVDESLYIKKGDSNIAETELGWLQAYRCGQFLRGLYTGTDTTLWPVVFLSGYLRTLQTFAGINLALEGIFQGEPRIYEDSRLVEKFFGAASALHYPHEKYDPKVIETLRLISKHVYAGDPLSAANLLGESTKMTNAFIKSFIDGTLRRDIRAGKRDFLFVTHGAVIQSFIMNWAHVPFRQKNKIGNPGNCDVIEIAGTSKNWTITKIYDGELFTPVKRNMVEDVKYLGVADLPPVPDFLRNLPK